MFTFITLFILWFVVGFIAYYSLQREADPVLSRYFHLILFAILVVFATFRDGSVLLDYNAYLDMFHSERTNFHVESSFYLIRSISKLLSYPGEYVMFFIYALLGIGFKYYAIKKYSPLVMFSLCVWISSYYILQDFIQMRASVAGGILLLIIPLIEQKKYKQAIPLFILAFMFHNSAIVFAPIFFMNSKSINWKVWTGAYLVICFMNISGFNFYKYLNEALSLLPLGFVNSRIKGYLIREYSSMGGQVSMFAPYIMLQTVACFVSMYKIDKLKEITPIAILAVKVTFLGIFIYSLSIPGVSMRLAELLSTATIYLYPLIIYWYSDRYILMGGYGTPCIINAYAKFRVSEAFYPNMK